MGHPSGRENVVKSVVTQMDTLDFLTPDTEQIRHQIFNILDSYSHEWDVLAELTQNAIDAVRQVDPEKGRLELTVNAATREISLSDNGIGVDSNQIQKLLRPFGTNKTGKPKQIGEKGVGLKFVIFSSSTFTLESSDSNGAFRATIRDASAWLASTGESSLQLSLEKDIEPKTQGTAVTVLLGDAAHPLFNYSFEDLIFILRTKTAVGDTGFIWDDPLNCDIKFTYFDKAGNRSSKTIECRYLLPTEPLKGQGTEDLDVFQEWLRVADRSDLEKRKRLLNKIVWTKGKRVQGGREIRYWSCFVPRRDYWNKLSNAVKVSVEADNDTEISEEKPGVGFTGGLETATKGMPTGISLELKPRGEAGYLPGFYMLVDDPSLKFDIGRKSIHGRQQGSLKELAFENFREYLNKVRKYLGGDIDTETADWDRDEIFSEIDQLPNLNSNETRFVKRPNAQEATVAALFFERVGRGDFSELRPLVSGYKDRYDLYALWKNRRIVLEFKYDLSGLLKDFGDERKMFNEINAVVLWEVTENDRTAAARRGMTIDPVQNSPLVTQTAFPHSSQRLSLGDVNPIFIIEMKRLVDKAGDSPAN